MPILKLMSLNKNKLGNGSANEKKNSLSTPNPSKPVDKQINFNMICGIYSIKLTSSKDKK